MNRKNINDLTLRIQNRAVRDIEEGERGRREREDGGGEKHKKISAGREIKDKKKMEE
jgi:hypothetical protein